MTFVIGINMRKISNLATTLLINLHHYRHLHPPQALFKPPHKTPRNVKPLIAAIIILQRSRMTIVAFLLSFLLLFLLYLVTLLVARVVLLSLVALEARVVLLDLVALVARVVLLDLVALVARVGIRD